MDYYNRQRPLMFNDGLPPVVTEKNLKYCLELVDHYNLQDKSDKQTAELAEAKKENLRLRAQMRRIEEECDILKKAARYFAR